MDAITNAEIDSITDPLASKFCNAMPPGDDVISQVDRVAAMAMDRLMENGAVHCFFTTFKGNEPNANLDFPTPTCPSEIAKIIKAGKYLAFSTAAHSVFFASEVFHQDGMIVLGQHIPASAQWGIQVAGSSARGNSFQCIMDITEYEGHFHLNNPHVSISRQSAEPYPLARLFHIQDEKELTAILRHSRDMDNPNERSMLVNFAVLMKSLLRLGYQN